MVGYKLLLLLTWIIIVSISMVIWLYPSSEDFRKDNPFWNGLSSFTEEFDASPASYPDNLSSSSTKDTDLLLIIPQTQFTNSEMQSIQDYLSLGKTVVILDDYGYGNDILAYLELDVRFSRYPLLDPLFNYKNKWFPEITDFSSSVSTENIESVVMNYATGLDNVSEDNIIAMSSGYSYLDLNNNTIHDDEDIQGPLPVAAALEVNNGSLVLIADPSILINSMENLSDNHTFIESILKLNDSDPVILIDQSHVPEASLDETKSTLATARRYLSSPIGISIVTVAALALTLSPIWFKKIKFNAKKG